MQDKLVHGLYAAVLTPRRSDDSFDEPAFARELEFLAQRGIASYAINGATGELCLTTPDQLKQILRATRKIVPDAKVLCGIGAAGITKSLELARIAEGEGCRALLLPMPYFFPYEQDDLAGFVEETANAARLPLLLYNLPDFTTALDPETSMRLIRNLPSVIGIKDSSGSLATLRLLTDEKVPSCRMVGNDGILTDAMRERVCDGVVSGVACVLPELICGLFAEREDTGSERFSQLSSLLNVFRGKLAQFPTPWALKWIAEARGISKATFAQPVTESRRKQGQELMAWYRKWEPEFLAATSSAQTSR
jgi:4-hydroxy-tetrahydrodipicolinate synthase